MGPSADLATLGEDFPSSVSTPPSPTAPAVAQWEPQGGRSLRRQRRSGLISFAAIIAVTVALSFVFLVTRCAKAHLNERHGSKRMLADKDQDAKEVCEETSLDETSTGGALDDSSTEATRSQSFPQETQGATGGRDSDEEDSTDGTSDEELTSTAALPEGAFSPHFPFRGFPWSARYMFPQIKDSQARKSLKEVLTWVSDLRNERTKHEASAEFFVKYEGVSLTIKVEAKSFTCSWPTNKVAKMAGKRIQHAIVKMVEFLKSTLMDHSSASVRFNVFQESGTGEGHLRFTIDGSRTAGPQRRPEQASGKDASPRKDESHEEETESPRRPLDLLGLDDEEDTR